MRYAAMLLALSAFTASTSLATMVLSDGSDGAFHPSGSQTIDLDSVAPDGVFNFTTIHIPQGVTISFSKNSLNTPVFFAATGDILIEGSINVSGHSYGVSPGPGGGRGGVHSATATGEDGVGLSPGQGGPITVNQGNGGGGGGMATEGLIATSRTGSNPGLGGPIVARPELVAGESGGGGSGGGGGGGRTFYGVPITGGDGGGGGGALQLSTPGDLTIAGSLITNGGHGGWAFANVFAHGGPGGGGSGGNLELHANAIAIEDTATISARGGAGGGLSTEPVANDPFHFSSGANGGKGYLYLGASGATISSNATILAAVLFRPGLVPGDANGDGVVSDADYTIWADNFGATGATPGMGDFNGDGEVTDADYTIWADCYGETYGQVPEPTTICLISLGGLMALRRRRQAR
jgi:dockerin type I repeat protein/PEP-CTERM motif-containing protein